MPPVCRSLPLSAVVLLAASACSPAGEEDQPVPVSYIGQGIMGGTEDTGDPAVVGMVIMKGLFGAAACTGSLIAPNLVLTARHCVSDINTGEQIQCGLSKYTSTVNHNTVFVTTDWNGPQVAFMTQQFTGNWYPPEAIIVPPEDDVCGGDIALIRLKMPGVPGSITPPLRPRLDAEVTPGEIYRAVGFGGVVQSGDGAGLRRQRTNLHVDCIHNCIPFYLNNLTEWQGETGICSGDSGGPALDSDGQVVGVVSRGGLNCSTPVYGSVSGWKDWIRQNTIEAAQLGGYPPPDWTVGGSGGSAGSGGSGGSAGSGGVGGSSTGNGPGTPCVSGDDCSSGICVAENSMTQYCSEPCSADAPDCPDGFECSPAAGACFLPGAFGSPCQSGPDCRTGICVADGNGQYCSLACSETASECPTPATCAVDQGACFLPPPPPPSTDSGSCSTHGDLGSGPTKPIPWVVGLAFLPLLVRRRRAR